MALGDMHTRTAWKWNDCDSAVGVFALDWNAFEMVGHMISVFAGDQVDVMENDVTITFNEDDGILVESADYWIIANRI